MNIVFLDGNKIAGSAQKIRVGQVSENTAIFSSDMYYFCKHVLACQFIC